MSLVQSRVSAVLLQLHSLLWTQWALTMETVRTCLCQAQNMSVKLSLSIGILFCDVILIVMSQSSNCLPPHRSSAMCHTSGMGDPLLYNSSFIKLLQMQFSGCVRFTCLNVLLVSNRPGYFTSQYNAVQGINPSIAQLVERRTVGEM